MDPTQSAQEIFIGRQPILDRDQQLFAYELLFRTCWQNSAPVRDDLAATATVIRHVFTELGLETALGPYPGFINLDARMLTSEVVEILPRDKFVMEILETVEITPEIVRRCRELKTMGSRLALVEKLEESDPLACHELIKRLPGLGVESVNASLARALAWANSIGRESA